MGFIETVAAIVMILGEFIDQEAGKLFSIFASFNGLVTLLVTLFTVSWIMAWGVLKKFGKHITAIEVKLEVDPLLVDTEECEVFRKYPHLRIRSYPWGRLTLMIFVAIYFGAKSLQKGTLIGVALSGLLGLWGLLGFMIALLDLVTVKFDDFKKWLDATILKRERP